MARGMQYKYQHFVPQCYLRSFSIDQNCRAVALYNIRSGTSANGVSIKRQCAKDYFYDQNGKIEAEFTGYEGKYAEVLRHVIASTGGALEDDLLFLRNFAYLQFLRTEAMAKHLALMMSDMADFLFDNDPEGRAWATINPITIPGKSIANFISTKAFLGDLCDCIVVNDTKTPFITSDNPAVILNRFHVQKQGQQYGGAGLLSSGVMLVMPLTPRLLFASYDKGVYRVNLEMGSSLRARRNRDVEALNALQVVRAFENLYFDKIDHAEYVRTLLCQYSSRRPTVWHKWIYAVQKEKDIQGEFDCFREVNTPEEFRAGKGLMMHKSVSVNPGIWCSLFPVRHKPKYFDTKSELGPVRSENLLRLHELKEPRFPIVIPRKK